MKLLLYWLLLVVLVSCQSAGKETHGDDPVVAKVGDVFLYQSEINSVIKERKTSKDSANIVQRYIDNWLKKQLLIKRAMEEISESDEVEIEKKVAEYRFQLLLYQAEKKFVEDHLDTSVSQKQIENYYLANQANFELKQNIVKGFFLKIPKDVSHIHKVKNMLYASKPPLEDIRNYATQYAEEFHITDTNWIYLDPIILGTPLTENLKNQTQTLRYASFFEARDDNYTYLLRVTDFKISNEISPLSFVEKNIRDIILNKRKIELRRQYEDDIFEKSIPGKDYEILVR